MKIKIKKLHPDAVIPKYAKPGDAGMDLCYEGTEILHIGPMERILVPTGLRVALPTGYELQIRSRSGQALKHGIVVLNQPGTIDSGFRNEIGVILINLSNTRYYIQPGDRVAQAVLAEYKVAKWRQVKEDEFDTFTSERGLGGFGHTGK